MSSDDSILVDVQSFSPGKLSAYDALFIGKGGGGGEGGGGGDIESQNWDAYRTSDERER